MNSKPGRMTDGAVPVFLTAPALTVMMNVSPCSEFSSGMTPALSAFVYSFAHFSRIPVANFRKIVPFQKKNYRLIWTTFAGGNPLKYVDEA